MTQTRHFEDHTRRRSMKHLKHGETVKDVQNAAKPRLVTQLDKNNASQNKQTVTKHTVNKLLTWAKIYASQVHAGRQQTTNNLIYPSALSFGRMRFCWPWHPWLVVSYDVQSLWSRQSDPSRQLTLNIQTDRQVNRNDNFIPVRDWVVKTG